MEHIFGMKYSTSGVTILKGQFKLTNTSQANQMLFQFSKTSRIFIDKKIVNLEEKEFLLLKPSQIITIESNVEDTMIFLFTLSDDLITSTNRNYQIIFEYNKWNKKSISNIESIGVSINKLISNLLNDNHEISFQTISLSFEFLYEFINVFATEYSTSSKELKKLEISNYIELNYRSELTLNSISQQFNMSSSYFSRYFKQLFEIGFLEFLTNYRIKRISEVAKSFVLNGFGIRCSDAIMKLQKSKPRKKFNDSLRLKELRNDEKSLILYLRKELTMHLLKSPIYFPTHIENYMDWFLKDEIRVFVACNNNEIIGFMSIQDEAETFISEADGMVNICGAFVKDEFRGKNVATDLLYYVCDVCEKEGAEYLGVDCETLNPNALRFWEKHFKNYTYSYHRRIDERIIGYDLYLEKEWGVR